MGFLSGFVDLLFPPKCAFCRRVLKPGEAQICEACKKHIPRFEGAEVSRKGDFFDECVCPLIYEGVVRESILRFKFHGMTNYAGCYGSILADCIRQNLAGKYDLITWVPLSAKRKKSRGYDQTFLLAAAAALELSDVAVDTLRKPRDVPAQSNISEAERRRANVSGAFEVRDRELVEGKRVLLIDDIVTTGATLSECARVLLMADAERVVCAALAGSRK